MPKTKPRLLVVDDEDSMLKTYKSMLKDSYEPSLANNGLAALKLAKEEKFDLVLLDIIMPEMSGLEVLKKLKQLDQELAIIMVTAIRDIKSAVAAIKLGAYDYINKPFELEELLAVIGKALERKALVKENTYLRQTLKDQDSYLDLIGETPVMKKVGALINKIAAAASTVLITGQSGTGKELVARAIHQKSLRASKPFVIVNCAAIPEALIEAELFGHEKGAFTGAVEAKTGKFELADNGTIFLDEIGCMKSTLQTKLLRVLQDNIIERVGGNKPLQVDVRIIAATNLDLEAALKKGRFREDLFYRLNVMRINLPSLRERKEDIPLFIDYFLKKYNRDLKKNVKSFSKEAIELLIKYDWPGNVRELQNFVERAVTLSDNNACLSADDIPLETGSRNIIKKGLKEAQDDFEKRYLKNALAEAAGNQSKAAEILGVNRTTLIAKIKKLGLE